MKCFIDHSTVYYIKDSELYQTEIDCYGFFDTTEGSHVRESTEQTERIRLLVTEKQLAQDAIQLHLL
jgi:hypothetical protein